MRGIFLTGIYRSTDREELLERGLGSQVRAARQRPDSTAGATNGTSDIGGADLPERAWIPYGDAFASG